MRYRIHPAWWPLLAPLTPALAILLAKKNKAFAAGVERAATDNRDRIARARPLALPMLDFLEITVVVEAKTVDGFLPDAAVSYLLESDRGSLLFDVGYGPSNPVWTHNWQRLDRSMEDVTATVISHLHLDHMGGLSAQRKNQIGFPAALAPQRELACYVPEPCDASHFRVEPLSMPTVLPAGFGTTGPLARMLFFLGYTREQSLVAHVKGCGLVVIVGCGHPSVEVILSMVRRLSDIPLHGLVGGLHFPITASRAPRAGIQVERIFGTGKKWNDPISDRDLDQTLEMLRRSAPKRLLLSAHDSCDHALGRMAAELDGEVEVLRAGRTYRFGAQP